jgi:hypothetical protein
MIIEPDFFEHWKTKALVELTKRPESPLWVMRLWAHCQTRKAWRFHDLPDIAIKSICGVTAEIDPAAWVSALTQCRFIAKDGDTWEVHDWKKHNAGLVANWKNGSRPKKKRATSHGQAPDKPPQSQLQIGSTDRLEGLDRGDKTDKITAHAIYEAYPKHVGKVDALKSIDRVLTRFDGAKLLAITQAYRAVVETWPPADLQFVPNPSTWFNQGRYEDDPGTWQRAQKNREMGGAGPFNPEAPNAHTGGLPIFEPEPAAAGGVK